MLALVGDDHHGVGFDDVDGLAGDLQFLGGGDLGSSGKDVAKLGEGDLAFDRADERALRLAQHLGGAVLADEPAAPGTLRARRGCAGAKGGEG